MGGLRVQVLMDTTWAQWKLDISKLGARIRNSQRGTTQNVRRHGPLEVYCPVTSGQTPAQRSARRVGLRLQFLLHSPIFETSILLALKRYHIVEQNETQYRLNLDVAQGR